MRLSQSLHENRLNMKQCWSIEYRVRSYIHGAILAWNASVSHNSNSVLAMNRIEERFNLVSIQPTKMDLGECRYVIWDR